MEYRIKPTPAQIRAARGLLNWQQDTLARLCGLSRASITQIELGKTQPTRANHEKITEIFWDAGIEFTEGEGVKRRTHLIEILEGKEGIVRFFDGIYEYVSAYGGEMLVSGVDEKMFDEAQGETAQPYIDRMMRVKNFTCKALIREDDDNTSGVDYAEYRRVPNEIFSNVPFYIYGNNLAIILWGKVKHKIIIHRDPELADAYRKQFYFIWQHGKPVETKKIG